MRTLVRLPISQAAFAEIAAKLRAADYGHCFLTTGEIAMDGIAVEPDPNAFMPPGVVEVDPRHISRDCFREIYGLDNLGNDNSETR
ncbi:hypothetical protein [Bradyrhizobium liaoningense]|uniref:hypothetical protein n=1 Tax=Bradyrhizobium liaoningense TaxID=43992 RepID=UPI001BAD3615|nr:hypothetical protein [Bradyrhizobium liaoningense]MBR1003887.1 hypothetical protein [Bradyrhizobium liaoningense]